MRNNLFTVPIAALALALGSFAGDATAQEERRTDDQRAQRRGRAERSQAQPRAQREGNNRAQAADGRATRNRNAAVQRAPRADQGNRPPAQPRPQARPRQLNDGRAPAQARGQQRAQGQPDNRAEPRARGRADNRAQPRDDRANRSARAPERSGQRGSGIFERNGRDDRAVQRNRAPAQRSSYDRGRYSDRRNTYRYYAPRLLPRRTIQHRYYGPGGHLSLYFGIGSGYRYGSWYSGRVYGYRDRAYSYGAYSYYGDVRLKVRPRHAAVYVDGYYAGVVDDFDGFFQRLTLEVGPHEIEIEAPGLEAQVFDVYVDASRTIDLHADLAPARR